MLGSGDCIEKGQKSRRWHTRVYEPGFKTIVQRVLPCDETWQATATTTSGHRILAARVPRRERERREEKMIQLEVVASRIACMHSPRE